jgi:hypothetical protein
MIVGTPTQLAHSQKAQILAMNSDVDSGTQSFRVCSSRARVIVLAIIIWSTVLTAVDVHSYDSVCCTGVAQTMEWPLHINVLEDCRVSESGVDCLALFMLLHAGQAVVLVVVLYITTTAFQAARTILPGLAKNLRCGRRNRRRDRTAVPLPRDSLMVSPSEHTLELSDDRSPRESGWFYSRDSISDARFASRDSFSVRECNTR